MAHIYLDEDVPRECGEILSRHGHDVVRAREIGHRSMPDSDHLKYAAETGRVLITYNRSDYEALHRLWIALNSWGIMDRVHGGILTSWGQIATATWANLVNEFMTQNSIMENRMWRWRRQQQDWDPVGW